MRRSVLPTAIVLSLSTLILTPALAQNNPAQNAAAYRQQGLLYRSQGQFPEAIDVLQKAVELDPEHLSGRVLLGWTAHLAGQEAQAAQVLQGNLNRDPFHIETLNALGIVYLVQGKVWGAIVTHGWAGLLKPDNEIAFYNLSLGLQRVGLFDWSIATAEYASILEPYNPHPLVALALAYGSKGDSSNSVSVDPALPDLVAAIRQLDDRYHDLEFLDHLEAAGFSPEQITQTRTLFQQH